jgi:hypothetical protein
MVCVTQAAAAAAAATAAVATGVPASTTTHKLLLPLPTSCTTCLSILISLGEFSVQAAAILHLLHSTKVHAVRAAIIHVSGELQQTSNRLQSTIADPGVAGLNTFAGRLLR